MPVLVEVVPEVQPQVSTDATRKMRRIDRRSFFIKDYYYNVC